MKFWHFDRYMDGELKAEGAGVHAETLEEAMRKARRLFRDRPGSTFRLQEVEEVCANS
jgi:hypothetical protein